MGLLPMSLPGYMRLPNDKDTSYEQYINAITPKDIVPNQVNYYRNTSKFFVSMMKTFYGDKATKENGWGFDFLPKADRLYDPITHVKLMNDGKLNGWIFTRFQRIKLITE